MKNTIIFFLFVTILTAKSSCSFSQEKKDTIVVNTYQLKSEEQKLWKTIYNDWFNNVYWSCLKKFNIKLDCGGCTKAIYDVQFYINNEGKVEKFEIIKEHVCGYTTYPELSKGLFEYFKTITFPAALRNMKLKTRLGTGLSC